MLLVELIILTVLLGDIWAEFDPFSDSIPFSIKWSGPLDSTETQLDDNVVTLPMITKDNKKYQCRFRNDEDGIGESKNAEPYTGPSAKAIIAEFASKTSCNYRMESYWTYELCHGLHIRQYHEERDLKSKDSKPIVDPEYFLGMYKKDQPEDVVSEMLLEGQKYPYLSVEYDEGTVCDLTKAPRRTTVQYICHEGGRGDLYQIKETSTCEYTAIVLLNDLCNHPSYRLVKVQSRIISCHSLEDAPQKPKMQEELDKALAQRPPKAVSRLTASTTTSTNPAAPSITKEEQESTRTGIGKSEDDVFLQNFLGGEYCLQGGTGWWSFELCYGSTATQFHVESGKRVTNIVLGKWSLYDHLAWLEKYPNKKPKSKPNRKYIAQFYSGGAFCEETQKPRAVEVRLKCSTSSGSSHAVAIYLLEPKVCEYILTVESPILCDLVDRADERGLIL